MRVRPHRVAASMIIPALTGWNVILALKVAVGVVTVLLLSSFIPLVRGNFRLHGRINIAFFVLTVIALLALEVVVRLINPRLFDYFDDGTLRLLWIHLGFAAPAAGLLPIMLWTGLSHRRWAHLRLAWAFGILWTGTVITGIFFLPHAPP